MTDPSIAITARGLYDYQHMFDLRLEDLTSQTFLDCASGASSFSAQVRARGGSVLAVDPAYDSGLAAIEHRVRKNLSGAPAWFAGNSEAINWSYLGSPDSYARATDAIFDLFSADFRSSPQSYLTDALPTRSHIPDNSVDTALCANLLFAYSELLEPTGLVAWILELCRVSRHRVLIHPISDRLARDTADLVAAVVTALQDKGFTVTIKDVAKSWLLGAQTMHITQSG